MEMRKPDTEGRVIIQLGGEPGSQGRQHMSSVYTSRNENHTGNKHTLVSLQDYNLISVVPTAVARELPGLILYYVSGFHPIPAWGLFLHNSSSMNVK